MKKRIVWTLLWLVFAGVVMLGMDVTVEATTVVIPLELSAWSQFNMGENGYGPGVVEKTSDGIKVWGNGYRGSSVLLSNQTADFSNADVYIKWMVNGGTGIGYMGTGAGVANTYGSPIIYAQSGQFGTTGWSYNGSSLLPINTWLFTHIKYNPNMTYTVTTSTGNYDTSGGSTLFNSNVSWASGAADWNNSVVNGRLMAGMGDVYDGTTAWVLVGEAKYVTASPSPSPVPVGYSPVWLIITLFSLILSGWYLMRRSRII